MLELRAKLFSSVRAGNYVIRVNEVLHHKGWIDNQPAIHRPVINSYASVVLILNDKVFSWERCGKNAGRPNPKKQ